MFYPTRVSKNGVCSLYTDGALERFKKQFKSGFCEVTVVENILLVYDHDPTEEYVLLKCTLEIDATGGGPLKNYEIQNHWVETTSTIKGDRASDLVRIFESEIKSITNSTLVFDEVIEYLYLKLYSSQL